MSLAKEIQDAIDNGDIKVYPEHMFKSGVLLRDIPSETHKGMKYDKGARIQFLPNGVYIMDGKELAGWFNESFELAEGQDWEEV